MAVESRLQDEVRRLIAALKAHLLTLTPPEFCSHMTVEEMAHARWLHALRPRPRLPEHRLVILYEKDLRRT